MQICDENHSLELLVTHSPAHLVIYHSTAHTYIHSVAQSLTHCHPVTSESDNL
jgi:hypothetical protein